MIWLHQRYTQTERQTERGLTTA